MELLISAESSDSGTRNSARCKLDSPVTLGRGPESPVPLDGTGISREHLRLHADGGAIFVTDLSSNGTWLNAVRLTRDKAHALAPADAIRIPGFEIRVELQDISPVDGQPSQLTTPPASITPAEPVRPGGPLQSVLDFAASLSKIEKLLIVLAVATFTLLGLYFAA